MLTDQKERLRKERCGTDYKAKMSTGPEEGGRQSDIMIKQKAQRFCGATFSPTRNLFFLVRKGEEVGVGQRTILSYSLPLPSLLPFSRIEEVENAKKIEALAATKEGCTKWLKNHS